MGGIFISYRRQDSAGWTGHLSEGLEKSFGSDQIFMDIEKIEAGTDFVEAIEKAVGSCNILLAVIGPAWLTSTDAEGRRRLDNPEDYIRLEITAALSRNIRVIPVLVGGAAMPASSDLPDDLKSLTRRQAHELTDNRWDYDTEQLAKIVEKAGIKRKHEEKGEPGTPLELPKKVSAKAVTSIVIALFSLALLQNDGLTLDMKIGGLVMTLAALVLGGLAFFDVKLHKAKGKILAIIGMVLSSLGLIVDIGHLSSNDTPEKPLSRESSPASVPQPSSPPPTDSPPVAPQPATSRPVMADISGIWVGSDGLTYSFQQQGNMVVVAGGYPNQAVLVTGSGIIRGGTIELDYIRIPDGTNGKARLSVSGDGRMLQGQYRNLVTGETGQAVFTR